ncbi:hypothetical protein DXG03_001820 [Asterophora parasitica]|uniref:Uncharacterized protein n=1 Tax=Asterophora parasitica TaxID=117018 RepID=A0A9P7G9H9_9AGAR|nr:hypothetical protein DXG03_001820 [Asterophora parasitica]
MAPAATLIKWKGYADIVLGVILATYPRLVYHSTLAQTVAALTGLHLSSPDAAPGLNHALACMFFALGVAHIAAARLGRGAHATLCESPSRHPTLSTQIKLISLYSHHPHTPHCVETLVAMSATWAVLTLLTCLLTPRAWRLGSASFFLSGGVHAVVCVFLWLLDPRLLRLSGAGNSRKWF